MNQPDQEVQDGNMAGKLINVLTFELGEYHPHQLFIQGFTALLPPSLLSVASAAKRTERT